jgi:hypothetical protein
MFGAKGAFFESLANARQAGTVAGGIALGGGSPSENQK